MCFPNEKTFKEGFEDFINIAPGADDNASGVAALLEIARVFSINDVKPIKTLVINFFAAEEQGLKGSNHTIESISNPIWKENIMAMINLDMVGYCTAQSDNQVVSIIKYNNSEELTNMAVEFAELYTELIPYTSTQYNMQSDSYSYNSYGVRSVFLSEYEFTPHYHTERDLFSTLNYDYLREQTRLATALVYECSVNNAYGTVSVQDITEVESIDLQILSSSSDNEIKFRVSGLKNRADVSLIDLYGRKIAQIHLKDMENIYSMPKNGLKSGIYILKLESNNQAISKKITLFQ
jgi:leucyl aminopeptidase